MTLHMTPADATAILSRVDVAFAKALPADSPQAIAHAFIGLARMTLAGVAADRRRYMVAAPFGHMVPLKIWREREIAGLALAATYRGLAAEALSLRGRV